MPHYEYECKNCGIIEVFHSIRERKTVCPECETPELKLLISGGSGVIIKGRQTNQYSDVKGAKGWRDKDGNLHKTSSSDGSYKSPTVSSKRKRTDEQAAVFQKMDRKRRRTKK